MAERRRPCSRDAVPIGRCRSVVQAEPCWSARGGPASDTAHLSLITGWTGSGNIYRVGGAPGGTTGHLFLTRLTSKATATAISGESALASETGTLW